MLIRLRRGTAAQVGRLDRLDVDRVVGAHQRKRGLVVEVGSLSAYVLVRARQHPHRLATAVTPLLAARDALLGLLERAFRSAVVAGIRDRLAIRRDEKYLQSHVDAGLASGEWQGLGGDLGTGAADVPAIRLARDGDRLDGALHRATPPHGDASDLRQHQTAVIQPGAVAVLLVGERVVALAPPEAREPRLLARLHPPEERLIGLVEACAHVLQHMAVDGRVLRHGLADGLDFCFLLVARERDVATCPGRDALFQGGVVKRAAAPQDALQLPLLGGGGPKLFLVGLAACLVAHTRIFQPGTTTSGGHQDFWLKPGAPNRQGSSPAACGGRKPILVRATVIGSGAIAVARTTAARCCRSGSWRRSGRRQG